MNTETLATSAPAPTDADLWSLRAKVIDNHVEFGRDHKLSRQARHDLLAAIYADRAARAVEPAVPLTEDQCDQRDAWERRDLPAADEVPL